METEILTAILGLAAAGLTLLTTWLASKKKEAYDQGDLILDGFERMSEVASGLAIVFPQLKAEADSLKGIYEAFRRGWDDKAFTTDEMRELYESAGTMFRAIMDKVSALKR